MKRLDITAKALEIPLKALFDFEKQREKTEYIEEFIVFKRNENGELVRERYGDYQSPPAK